MVADTGNKRHASSLQWRERNPQYPKMWRKLNPEKYLIHQARYRARLKRLKFSISEVDILPLPTHCPVLGTRLVYGGNRYNPRSASLDRIDNSKGYTPKNVAVISQRANMLKSNGTLREIAAIAGWMLKHRK